MPLSPQSTPFGINLYGHVSGDFGLAVAARNTLRALAGAGVGVCAVDVDPLARRAGRDDSFASLACDSAAGSFGVSLFHTNPPNMRFYSAETPAATWKPDRLRVLVPFWELPVIPPGIWTDFTESMDLVLAPTRFVADAITASCPGVPVLHYPQAVFLPYGVAPDRSRFDVPEGAFVCLTVMDAGSGFERKNPMASVAAFREAFEGVGPDEVRLVVKLTDRSAARSFAAQIDEFRADAESDPRITVIERSMSYRDVLSLNASADALISLHRSEGLGLHLMEAMSLGTVVVGTGWSGNMDFMTGENSVVVPGERCPIRSANEAYDPAVIGEGQYWMDPDVHAAAAGLRRLFDDRSLLRRLAQRASEDMDLARERFVRVPWLEDVRESYERGLLGRDVHAERSARFREAMRVGTAERSVREARNALRRVKRAAERALGS